VFNRIDVEYGAPVWNDGKINIGHGNYVALKTSFGF
jgi:hypothetical protein